MDERVAGATGRADWTRAAVEAALVAAFQAIPSHPVLSNHARIRTIDPGRAGVVPHHLDALNWTARFVRDREDALALLIWARCIAGGASVRERYEALGWSRATAERRRRRALARVVSGLNARSGWDVVP